MYFAQGYDKRDLSRLYQIEKTCFHATQRWSEESANEEFSNGLLLTCHEDGGIVGYCLVRDGYIVGLAVVPEHRGKGIAHKLMAMAEHETDGARMTLHVWSGNPAQKLYFDLGYRTIKVERDFYAPGLHALFMEKVIR